MKNMNDVTKQMLEKTNDGQRKQHLSEEVFCNPIFSFCYVLLFTILS